MNPSGWARLFDFDDPGIGGWEVSQIRSDASDDRIIFPDYALSAGMEDGIDSDDMLAVILRGSAVEKDLPDNGLGRAAGIAFLLALWKGADVNTKVKVGEWYGLRYAVVTTHEL